MKTTVPFLMSVLLTMCHNAECFSQATDTVSCEVVTLCDAIGEIVITAPARQMRVADNGALLFDAKTIAKAHPTANAMDLLEGISTIQKTGDEYTLIGTSSTTILINGRKSSLTQEQIKSQLMSMSPEMVKNIEVFYNTPAKYGVKGASVNINLVEDKTENIQISGDVSLSGIFRHYASYEGNANVLLTSKKISASMGYALSRTKKQFILDLMSEHTVGLDLYDIVQQTTTDSKRTEHKLYADLNWISTTQSSLSFSYSANFQETEDSGSSHHDDR